MAYPLSHSALVAALRLRSALWRLSPCSCPINPKPNMEETVILTLGVTVILFMWYCANVLRDLGNKIEF